MKKASISLSDAELLVLSYEARKSIFEICLNANSGHIGGCSGAVELLITLYFGGILRYNCKDAPNISRDIVLIRGHIGPLRYKIFSLLGYIHESELNDYRKYGSRLPGHEDYLKTPGIDLTPSGSLGMILSYGVGSAYAAKQEKNDCLSYVFLGDGEEQEGNVSEAARHAAHMRLNNLIVIIDRNAKQLSNPTAETDSSDLPTIWRGYGWETLILKNGHDISAIRNAYQKANIIAQEKKRPVVIIANTDKGRGIKGNKAHFSGYHTISTCSAKVVKLAIEKIRLDIVPLSKTLTDAKKKILSRKATTQCPVKKREIMFKPVKLNINPLSTTPRNPDMCQLDYFRILGDMIERKDVRMEPMFFLTADVTRKDHVEQLRLDRFCTFINTGIREQHTIAMAHGLSLSLPKSRILINSFDAFTYRSLDQLNAAAQGDSSMVIIGDVSGLTNSRNGKTHQTSGQPGALLMMPGVTLLEPWDVLDTFHCLNWAIGESRGVVFIRIHSSNIPSISLKTKRNINWYVAHQPISEPDLTIVASGLVVGSALEAAYILEKEGLMIRTINLINHKKLDKSFSKMIPNQKPLLTVYNGYSGVLQANIARTLLETGTNIPSKLVGLGFDFGATGSTNELLHAYGIDAEGIVRIAKKELLKKQKG